MKMQVISRFKTGMAALLALALVLSWCLVPLPAQAETTLPAEATETGNGYYRYQAEYFYTGNISENVAANFQPGEILEIPVGAVNDFVEGRYILTVRSCGNRESFEILVNGESVGTITRTGNGFGMDQMTDDKLSKALTLKPGDVLSIKAPDGKFWGWVDYIQLDVDTGYTIEAENGTFSPEISNAIQINDQGDQYVTEYNQMTATYTVPAGVASGKYMISARYVSAVDQKKLQIVCGGQTISASWAGTGGWTWPTNAAVLKVGVLELKPGDKFEVHAIENDAYIQIDYFRLTPLGANEVVLDQVSATLDGTIGLNYFVKLPESLKNIGARVQLTVNGTVRETIGVDSKTAETDGRYRFTCPLNAKEMHDSVKFEVLDSQGNPVVLCDKNGTTAESFTYSLADYFKKISESADEKLANLAKATLTYGSYAQVHFKHNDAAEMLDKCVEISGVTAATLDGKKLTAEGTKPKGLSTARVVLSLEEVTTIKLSLNTTDTNQYTFELDGQTVTSELKNNQYYFEIPNIAAKDLDKEHVLEINGEYTIKFTALSYAYAVLTSNNQPDDLQDVVKALYKYNEAANAYFGA